MSYETYALGEDRVRATPLVPITLKGISREVVPYAIEDIYDHGHTEAPRVLEEVGERYHLYVDLAGLDTNESDEIEAALASALREVRNRRKRDG